MLYIVLGLAVVFYASLFWVWSAAQPHLDSTASRLAAWRQLIYLVPDQTALLVLRELILLTLVYLAFDGAVALVRRVVSHKTPRHSWHDGPPLDAARRDDSRAA